jgi:signal transduction histidine kinase
LAFFLAIGRMIGNFLLEILVSPFSHRICKMTGFVAGMLWAVAGLAQTNLENGCVTNVAGLFAGFREATEVRRDVRIEARVCSVSRSGREFILADESGAELVMLEEGQTLQPGQRVLLSGTGCQLVKHNWGVAISRPAVVDNDGLHGLLEKSGAVFLEEGRVPIRVEWFNGGQDRELKVAWQPPGQDKIPIPDAALFRRNPDALATNSAWLSGLNYRCFEGQWLALPDFQHVQPVTSGAVTNFNLDAATRHDDVGLEFTGLLEVKTRGEYVFSVGSDDGAKLFVGAPPLQVRVEGDGAPPTPLPLKPGASLGAGEKKRWSEVTGVVQNVIDHADSLELELFAGQRVLRAGIVGRAALPVPLLLNSVVRVRGVSGDAFQLDGSTRFGLMELVSPQDISIEQLSPELANSLPVKSISEAKEEKPSAENFLRMAGQIRAGSAPGCYELVDGTNAVALKWLLKPSLTNGEVEAFGFLDSSGVAPVFECGHVRAANGSRPDSSPLPLLTTTEQVQRLSRTEAARSYPARIRGVIISDAPELNYGRVIQDENRGMFFYMVGGNEQVLPPPRRPRLGEYWEITGTTGAGAFAPVIHAKEMTYLGVGQMPAPLQPAEDELMTGALDTQWVEMTGIITDVNTNGIVFLTHGGKIVIQVAPAWRDEMRRHENSLVRLRGCLLAVWEADTRRMLPGEFRLVNLSLLPDAAEQLDPFSAPLKKVGDLRLYDLQANAFHRVKISGQFLQKHAGEYFMMSEGSGVRFLPSHPQNLHPGDLIVVAGLPDLQGAAPVLREAEVRTAGSAVLPAPLNLTGENLLQSSNDSVRVQIQARLQNVQHDQTEQILEVVSGVKSFVARVPLAGGSENFVPGSRLFLTGVLAGRSAGHGGRERLDSFELLIYSPLDIRVVSLPPWWTFKRLLVVVGILSGVLAVVALWVFQLRRRIEAQTRIIRENVEHTATLEERSRIARELHDSLEQALAGVNFQLGALADHLKDVPASTLQILERARLMVRHGQAEARRTVRNLRMLGLGRNNLAAMLEQLANETFSGREIKTELSVTGQPVPLPAELENHLLRIGQEAMTNTLKHAKARNLRIELRYLAAAVELEISDDGCGFQVSATPTADTGHFGLLGMRERIEKMKGTFELSSRPGSGTVVSVKVPVPLGNAPMKS